MAIGRSGESINEEIVKGETRTFHTEMKFGVLTLLFYSPGREQLIFARNEVGFENTFLKGDKL